MAPYEQQSTQEKTREQGDKKLTNCPRLIRPMIELIETPYKTRPNLPCNF